jgi:hypothetical protein
MKRLLVSLVFAGCATNSALATEVGVSITAGQPGFYGRIDIGNFPQPRLLYSEPVIIEPVRVVEPAPPIYLHVPPGHAKNWRKHCQKYDACGRRVYFVQDDWYNNVYVPEYSRQHGKGKGKNKDKNKDKHK